MAFERRRAVPAGWETESDDYEYIPLRLPPDVTRLTASMRLAIKAEFGGWELSRVRLYTDGSRRILLRRRKRRDAAADAHQHGDIGEPRQIGEITVEPRGLGDIAIEASE